MTPMKTKLSFNKNPSFQHVTKSILQKNLYID